MGPPSCFLMRFVFASSPVTFVILRLRIPYGNRCVVIVFRSLRHLCEVQDTMHYIDIEIRLTQHLIEKVIIGMCFLCVCDPLV